MRLEKTQWISLSVLLGIVSIAIAAFFLLFAKRIPDYVYSPTRYAFVTDKNSSNMAIIDLNLGEQVETQSLKSKPDIFTIDTINPIMAYANFSEAKVYFYDMRKRKNIEVALPEVPVALFFIPDRQDLVVVMKNKIALANYEKSMIYPLADVPDQIKIDQNHIPAFSAIDASLWAEDQSQAILYRLSVGQSDPQWEAINTALGNTQIGVIATNPQGNVVAYSAFNDQQALALTDKQKHFQLGVSAAKISSAPFINANNRTVIFGRENGAIDIYDLQHSSYRLTDHIVSDQAIIKILGGWLNQVSVVLAKDAVVIVNNYPFFIKARFSFMYEPQDMWITGDGKTALITYAAGQQSVMLFDLQTGTQRKPIVLEDISHANFIRMGGNNSFCY